jgi:hypothetical protein
MLAPEWYPLERMVPQGFPLLLVVPALCIDLLVRRVGTGRDWTLALLVGPGFVLTLLAVQWPFSGFLLSLEEPNSFVATGYWDYHTRPGPWARQWLGMPGQTYKRGVGALTIVRAGATDAIAAPEQAVTSVCRGHTATVVGGVILTLMLFGGWRWWQAVEQDYQQELYRTVPATAAIDTTGSARVAGRDAELRFTVRDEAGEIVRLSPYQGMAGHAVVQRTDGEVYIHLHPNGTVSMGAQEALAVRQLDDTLPGMATRRLAAASGGHEGHDTHAMHQRPAFDGTLVFPYAFPFSGEYRGWVQFRREGRDAIETAAFRVVVPGA